MAGRSKLEEDHCALSWRLIEWKVAYYRPEFVHPSRKDDYTISDAEYDAKELQYLKLCRKLGQRNTIVHKTYPGYEDLMIEGVYMVEIDMQRPSVELVISKLSSPKAKA